MRKILSLVVQYHRLYSSPGDAGQSEGEDVVPLPGNIFNDEEVATSEPVFDDAMGDVGPSKASGLNSSRKHTANNTLLRLEIQEGLNDQLRVKRFYLCWRMGLKGVEV